MNSPTSRPCILILGMHRSGTSALTRTLALLGLDMPKTLVGGDEWNEGGYWEPAALVILNDRILQDLGSTWHDWRPIDANWFRSPAAAEFRKEAVALLQSEYTGTLPFALKDPRICRLAKFWSEALIEAGASPSAILPVRNPLEVAASLQRRNGFQPWFSYLLWLRHVLDAEAATRGTRRIVTTYDQLIADWRQTATRIETSLGLTFERGIEDAAGDIDAYLSETYRHHRSTAQTLDGDPSAPHGMRRLFAILETWADMGERAEDYAEIDAIRAEFDGATTALSATAAASDAATGHMQTMDASLADMESRVRKLESDRAPDPTAEVQRLGNALAETEQRIHQLEAGLARAAEKLESQAARIDDLAGELAIAKARRPRLGWSR